MGVWIDAGNKDRKKNEERIAPFLEAMLFKGTKRDMRRQIAALITGSFILLFATFASGEESIIQAGNIRRGWVGGYIIAGTEKVDLTYNAGFSMYSAAWPLLKEYPGHEFQSGLFGTWMFPLREKAPEGEMYSDIEGGLGWWRDTHFPTVFPKFIMGGVQLNFAGWANTPGSGHGDGKYGVVQLSPWLLFPPDGLNLKQGTCGGLFGYGYLPLPLTEVKSKTAGKDFPTGNQWWTLFINAANFKGPVAAFTPFFWSRVAIDNPKARGMFLDILPSDPNKAYEMETQFIPCAIATDSKGEQYLRLASTQFPVGPDGTSLIMNNVMVYSRKALWDRVNGWLEGGQPVGKTIDVDGACQVKFNGKIWMTWRVYEEGLPGEKATPIDIGSFIAVDQSDPASLRFIWKKSKLIGIRKTRYGNLLVLPEYYRLVNGTWVAVAPEDVPPETGLKKVTFAKKETLGPRVTPAESERYGKEPGPVAGPFKVKLGDGSTVTYYWYRFADQPSLLNADLTPEEREEIQRKVEKIHRLWTKNRNYLPPPSAGKLAEIDPALIVTPPKGLEVGYVPIVTRQEIER